MKALVSVRPMVVILFQVLLLRWGTNKSDFCNEGAVEAKEGTRCARGGLGGSPMTPFCCLLRARSVRAREIPCGSDRPPNN